jgi:hypothetical protein
MGTACDPHDDEGNAAVCFLTLMVKLTGLDPDTVLNLATLEFGRCCWSRGFVPLPLKLFSRTEIVPSHFEKS